MIRSDVKLTAAINSLVFPKMTQPPSSSDQQKINRRSSVSKIEIGAVDIEEKCCRGVRQVIGDSIPHGQASYQMVHPEEQLHLR